MHKLRRLLVKTDTVIYLVERVLLLISVVLMISLVFVDVVQRTFSRPVGKTADFMLWSMRLFGEVSPETTSLVQGSLGRAIFGIGSLAFCVAAVQSSRTFAARRGGDESATVSIGPSFLVGGGLFLLAWGAIEALLYAAPQGIPGAQKFALGFLVWSGFIGASLAVRAKRHIVLDALKKKLGPDVAPSYALIGAILTSGYCLFISYMGFSKGFVEIAEWSESGHVIHVYEALPIPTWVVTLAIPTFLTIGAFRFFFIGLSELLYGAPLATGADEHGIDFEALENQVQADAKAALNENSEAPKGAPMIIGRLHESASASGSGEAS